MLSLAMGICSGEVPWDQAPLTGGSWCWLQVGGVGTELWETQLVYGQVKDWLLVSECSAHFVH